MMGSGKSTVGRLVAARHSVGFADTDDEIAAAAGHSVAALWADRGEQAFRDLEAAQVARLAEQVAPLVIATGGGAVLRDGSVVAMRGSGTVVWLTAEPAVLAGRVDDGRDRPLLGTAPIEGRLADILAVRRAAYGAAADTVIDTNGRDVDEVVIDVEAAWAHM